MNKLATAALLAIMLTAWSGGVYASEYHVDPGTVSVVYSGIALLRYYSNSLDFVIQKDPSQTQEYLGVLPFANVPPTITNPAADFAQSAIAISQALPEIDQLFAQHDTFIAQSRLTDAVNTSAVISADIKTALVEVGNLEKSAMLTGDKLKVASVSAKSDLQLTYAEVMAKIERIRGMLTFLAGLNASNALQDVLNSRQPTSLTLDITPLNAFVGDNVHFDALLTASGQPLAGRNIDISLDGSQYITGTTDINGRCSGELTLPLWYVPQIEAQAFYQPQSGDVGLFLASMSPATTINVLFYKVSLGVSIDGAVYPGKTAIIDATLDYGASPPLIVRTVGLYLDDAPVADLTADTNASFTLAIDPQMPPGPHSITLSTPANGRYAPAVSTVNMEVTQAVPVLVLDTPRIALVPGNIRLTGKAYSVLGPLNGATLIIGTGNSRVETTTASDGTFDATLKIGMDLTLLGSRAIPAQLSPVEPWNARLSDSRSMFSVNYVNCLLAVFLLALLGIYLPNRLRKRLGFRREQTYGVPEPVQLDIPLASNATVMGDITRYSAGDKQEPRSRIFSWYLHVLKFIQKLAGLKPRPQQTMREFALENGPALGPLSRYLLEITLLTERFLYSSHTPFKSDVDKSHELAQALTSEVKDETV